MVIRRARIVPCIELLGWMKVSITNIPAGSRNRHAGDGGPLLLRRRAHHGALGDGFIKDKAAIWFDDGEISIRL